MRRPLAAKGEERARALALSALLWDLVDDGADELVIERRQERNNRRDTRTITGAKAAKRAPPGLGCRFEAPEKEPILWFADAVASATSAVLACARGSERYTSTVSGCVERVEVGP